MGNLRFFDTAALQHRYVSGPESRRIRRLIGDSRDECFVAEWTILEIASALAKRCRIGSHSVQIYDQWDLRFFSDIARGKLRVRAGSQRDVLKARQLIRFAGVLHKRNLGSGDALIASACLELALERRAVVTFYTSDWTLYSTVRDIDAFTSALRIVYVGTPRGGLPAVSGWKRSRRAIRKKTTT